MTTRAVSFANGSEDMKALLGGKGAGLAGMAKAGFPVPDGFTITTDACREYYETDRVMSAALWEDITDAISGLESSTGKTFGGDAAPLLVSVRSGAAVSMPGMMDTILNLGLNDVTVHGLAELTGDAVFAWESYRRFVQMFGEIVFDVPSDRLTAITEAAKANGDMSTSDMAALVNRLKDVVAGYAKATIPDEPLDQLRLAVGAVFDSWGNRRAIDYRRMNEIPDDLFTAVTVQSMVFGNAGPGSGTGVAFTRDPMTGEPVLYGEFLENAQGEDVVAGIRTPEPISGLADLMPDVFSQLTTITQRLEEHYRDMQDVEFTVEQGNLFMLQTRAGKRTGRSAIRIAVDMTSEGLLSKAEAVQSVTADRVEELLHPIVVRSPETQVITSGLPASPGGAAGVVVFDPDEAVELAEAGVAVVLVRHETSPDDFHGMVAAEAIVTAAGRSDVACGRGGPWHGQVLCGGLRRPGR